MPLNTRFEALLLFLLLLSFFSFFFFSFFFFFRRLRSRLASFASNFVSNTSLVQRSDSPRFTNMGVPTLYRWLSERYPMLNQQANAAGVPDIDNWYVSSSSSFLSLMMLLILSTKPERFKFTCAEIRTYQKFAMYFCSKRQQRGRGWNDNSVRASSSFIALSSRFCFFDRFFRVSKKTDVTPIESNSCYLTNNLSCFSAPRCAQAEKNSTWT